MTLVPIATPPDFVTQVIVAVPDTEFGTEVAKSGTVHACVVFPIPVAIVPVAPPVKA